jgi:Fur family zinc uptake transcriptional regulator
MSEMPNLTKNQNLVFEALSAADGPLSAYAILDRLRTHGLRAPLQVYRALDKLLDYGLVHRLESLNAFVACSHPHADENGMTAFAICETCGEVVEFTDDEVRRRLDAWTGENGFAAAKTTIEIRGTCARCQSAKGGTASQPN